MHSPAAVAEVLALGREGLGRRRISHRTGLPLSTVRDWLAGRVPKHSVASNSAVRVASTCARCGHVDHHFDAMPPAYTYLLGLYLGDGTISRDPRNVFRLRIFLDLRYPQIIESCAAAMSVVMPSSKVHRFLRRSHYTDRPDPSHVEVSSFSKAWPCLFPQYGPGRKHERQIVLADWQLKLVRNAPDQLLRGLIQSDGCRFQNTGRGNWTSPRYSFSNRSEDIKEIFCQTCDVMSVHWTRSGESTIYVSRKADVARLDEFNGLKC